MTKFEIELSDADLVYVLNDYGAFSSHGSPEGRKIGQQIKDQLPPPRMAEPGWGEKVTASLNNDRRRVQFLRFRADDGTPYRWITPQYERAWNWDDLISPEPVDGAS